MQAKLAPYKQQTPPFRVAFVFIFCSELLTRLELVTSSLPRKCSTTELQQHFALKARQKYNFFFVSANFFANKLNFLLLKYYIQVFCQAIACLLQLQLCKRKCLLIELATKLRTLAYSPIE